MHRTAVTVLLLVAPFLVPEPTHAVANPAITVTTVSAGVRLSLTVPRRVYMINALARVTVQVRNVSSHPVWTRIGVTCITYYPSVEVMDDHGALTPQLPSDFFPPPCPWPGAQQLPSGEVVREHVLAIVGGTHISAVLLVGKHLRGRVETPAVTVSLILGTPLSVAVHASLAGPFVQVDRPAGATGPLYVEDSTFCHLSGGRDTYQSNLIWSPAPAGPVYPNCGDTQEWHGLAGYLNYPVAAFNYVKAQG
jgi:hypothetical protein